MSNLRGPYYAPTSRTAALAPDYPSRYPRPAHPPPQSLASTASTSARASGLSNAQLPHRVGVSASSQSEVAVTGAYASSISTSGDSGVSSSGYQHSYHHPSLQPSTQPRINDSSRSNVRTPAAPRQQSSATAAAPSNAASALPPHAWAAAPPSTSTPSPVPTSAVEPPHPHQDIRTRSLRVAAPRPQVYGHPMTEISQDLRRIHPEERRDLRRRRRKRREAEAQRQPHQTRPTSPSSASEQSPGASRLRASPTLASRHTTPGVTELEAEALASSVAGTIAECQFSSMRSRRPMRSAYKWMMHRITGRCELERLSRSFQPGAVEECIAQSKQLSPSVPRAVLTQALPQDDRRLSVSGQSPALSEGGTGLDWVIAPGGRRSAAEDSKGAGFASLESVVGVVVDTKPIMDIEGFRLGLGRNLQAIQNVTRSTLVLQRIAGCPYDPNNCHHETLLARVWGLLKPDKRLSARISRDWESLGFQGMDPATDFRGSGLLGLLNLHFFADRYTDQAKVMLEESAHPSMWYSFAITGINISSWLKDWLLERVALACGVHSPMRAGAIVRSRSASSRLDAHKSRRRRRSDASDLSTCRRDQHHTAATQQPDDDDACRSCFRHLLTCSSTTQGPEPTPCGAAERRKGSGSPQNLPPVKRNVEPQPPIPKIPPPQGASGTGGSRRPVAPRDAATRDGRSSSSSSGGKAIVSTHQIGDSGSKSSGGAGFESQRHPRDRECYRPSHARGSGSFSSFDAPEADSDADDGHAAASLLLTQVFPAGPGNRVAPPPNLHHFFFNTRSPAQAITTFNFLYVYTFHAFHRFWFQQRPSSLLDFPRISLAFRKTFILPMGRAAEELVEQMLLEENGEYLGLAVVDPR